MALSDTSRRAGPFTGDGVATDFPVPFRVISDGDLAVVQSTGPGTAETLVQGLHYSILGVNDPTGCTVVFDTPPATGVRIDIIGAAPYTQPLTLYDQGPYFASDVMNGMDRIVVLIQQLREELDRAIVLPVHLLDTDLQGLIDILIALGPQVDNIILIAQNMPQILLLLDALPTITALLDFDLDALVIQINTLMAQIATLEALLGRITLSTEPPSGGQAGDLWFRVHEE